MATAEQLAKSIQLDGQGVHVLLWDHQDDLVRALIVLFAALHDTPLQPLLLASAQASVSDLRKIFELRPQEKDSVTSEEDSLVPSRQSLLVLFLQQATSSSIGPWLNGWRSALAEKPGALLVVRHADFLDFQRNAPDLASFFASKAFDTSSMLSIWSASTAKRMKTLLPREVVGILGKLPGKMPSGKDIESWVREHPPLTDQ